MALTLKEKAQKLVAAEPDLTPTELSKKVGCSSGYATQILGDIRSRRPAKNAQSARKPDPAPDAKTMDLFEGLEAAADFVDAYFDGNVENAKNMLMIGNRFFERFGTMKMAIKALDTVRSVRERGASAQQDEHQDKNGIDNSLAVGENRLVGVK